MQAIRSARGAHLTDHGVSIVLNKHFLAASLAFAAMGASAAEPIAPATNGLTPFLGIGLTLGGDQIGEDIQYQNDSSRSIHAGGMIDLRAGVEYQTIGSPLSFQLSVSYHTDRASAENGSVTFSRVPLEALMHYRLNESWRVGGGLRKAMNAELSVSGAGNFYAADTSYKSSAGIVLEAEVFFGPRVGLKLRGVKEDYTPERGGKKIDGSHVGVIGAYYFK
jgi:hypothetical protein